MDVILKVKPTQIMLASHFWRHQAKSLFLDPKLIGPKIYFDPIFFGARFIKTQILFDPKFYLNP